VKISRYVSGLITENLLRHRILVWYDGEKAFRDFVSDFEAANCNVVSAGESLLQARREAEKLYCRIGNPDASYSERTANLLIYLPFKRSTGFDRLQDPFEVFVMAGDAFGDNESEQLQSLALQALPDFADEIDRLFREGQPTLKMLDHLEKVPTYPLVHKALGTRSVVDVSVLLLGGDDTISKISNVAGCSQEALRLLREELGFSSPPNTRAWDQRRKFFSRYVLFSDFAFDYRGKMPEELANVSRASEIYQEKIYAITDRLRNTLTYIDTYIQLANQVESDLQLADYFHNVAELGQRDTFAFEERQHLAALTNAVEENDLQTAEEILADRRNSVWRHQPERAQIWTAAERCLTLLEVAEQVAETWKSSASSLPMMIGAYSQDGGWSELDRTQRLMEQSIAECHEKEELEEIISRSRSRYRQVIDHIQYSFIELIEQYGYPPEDFLRQTQIFDQFVAPALAAREKVAFILADSLRFEMGRDLGQTLEELGEVEVQPALASLPTVTSVGMAALLPGADGALEIVEDNGELIPFMGENRLKNLADRRTILEKKLGDRFTDAEISDFLSKPSIQKQEALLQNVDLVTMRDFRIDRYGEAIPLREARRSMTEMLSDLKVAIKQLVRLGYTRIVVATDHGHVLLPEILPGDIISSTPDGEWTMQKRRALLGKHIKEGPGTHIFNAAHLGIHGDVGEVAIPKGFGVYTGGTGYFHGGISLQECVIPVIALRATVSPTTQVAEEIKLKYRSELFTSRVIGIKVWFNSLMSPSIRVKIEAYDGPGPKANRVGEAADCDARDEVTHEVTLLAGRDTPVPVLLDPDFAEEHVEIRAMNPDAPVVWDRLTLRNEILE
jgi:hypothetical protein